MIPSRLAINWRIDLAINLLFVREIYAQHGTLRQPVISQVAIDQIMAHLYWRMVGVVGDRVVDLACQQALDNPADPGVSMSCPVIYRL